MKIFRFDTPQVLQTADSIRIKWVTISLESKQARVCTEALDADGNAIPGTLTEETKTPSDEIMAAIADEFLGQAAAVEGKAGVVELEPVKVELEEELVEIEQP